jgi:hypothetical protein
MARKVLFSFYTSLTIGGRPGALVGAIEDDAPVSDNDREKLLKVAMLPS